MGQIRLLPAAAGYLEVELRYNSDNLMKLALGGSSKAGMVAGARFSSNFNTDAPALVVQIPVTHHTFA